MASLTSSPSETGDFPADDQNSFFDKRLSQLVVSLTTSHRNIERSMAALRGIARAENAYQDAESHIIGARTGLVNNGEGEFQSDGS